MPPKRMPTDPNKRATTVRNLDITVLNKISRKRKKKKAEGTQNSSGNRNTGANNSIPNNKNSKNIVNRNSNRAKRKPKTSYPPYEICAKKNHSTERCFSGANAANKLPPRNKRREIQNQVQQRNNQSNAIENTQAAAQNKN